MVQLRENIDADVRCYPEKQSLLSKYQIPEYYLDFDYVKICKNGKELEKIVHILRSGEEGYFPDLTKAAEERLAQIKPNSKLLRTVCPVISKHEVDKNEWEDLTGDLNTWLKDMTKNDRELTAHKSHKHDTFEAAPSIRQSQDIIAENKKTNPKRISSTDYESWDKYDVDTEILKMDLEQEKMKKDATQSEKQKPKTQKRVSFCKFNTIAEALFEANRQKECGNEYYKAGEYHQALEHYNQSLECKPTVPVYTNRALVYMKLKRFVEAVDDCEKALKIEPQNVKALLRIAQSLDELKQYEEACGYVEKAIRIAPNNEAVQSLAAKLQPYGKSAKSTRMVVKDVEAVNIKIVDKHFKELIPIPGCSKMPPPYYVVLKSESVDAIKQEKRKILGRVNALYKPTIDGGSDDDDCCVNHVDRRKEKETYSFVRKENEELSNLQQAQSTSPRHVEKGNKKENCTLVQKEEEESLSLQKKEGSNHVENCHKKEDISVQKEDEQLSSFQQEESPNHVEKGNRKDNYILVQTEEEELLSLQKEDGPNHVEKGNKKETVISVQNEEEQEKSLVHFDVGDIKETVVPVQKEEGITSFPQESPAFLNTTKAERVEDDGLSSDEIATKNNQTQKSPAVAQDNSCPTDLHSPYSFLKSWNSIQTDNTYAKHAELLKNLNVDKLVDAIGYNIDGEMFSAIIKCLHSQFMSGKEIDRLHKIMANLAQVQRFHIMVLFLPQVEMGLVRDLIEFLNRHDRSLPEDVRKAYLG